MNYLFYDLETTGLSASFDQIVRFAAIKADQNLEEIDRYETTYSNIVIEQSISTFLLNHQRTLRW